MGRREEPRVGVGGEGGGLRLAIDDGDVVAIAIELVGGGNADDAGAEDEDLQITASTMISTS
jgi:hypothetical protein